MRVLVTGGTGFIGKNLLKELNNKYEFVVLGKRSIDEITVGGKGYVYLRTNYSTEHLVECLKDIDAVVHLSAKKVEKDSVFKDYIQDNIVLTSNLLDACNQVGITNVINLSSRMVYDVNDKVPWKETSRENPMTYYGISKLTIDKLINYYNVKNEMNIKSLRVSQVFGLDNDNISINQKGFMIMKFIELAMNKKPITIYGIGNGIRDYIYIKDLINAIDSALSSKFIKGIFNIGSGIGTTHNELAIKINRIFNNEGNLTFNYDAEEDVSVYLLDINSAKDILNFEPQYSLDDALLDIKKILEQQ